MRIAYFTDTFWPVVNGVVIFLANITAGLVDKNHKILICAPRPGNGKKINWRQQKVQIEYLPSLPALVYPGARIASPLTFNLIEKVKNFNPEIIHLQTSFLVGSGALILGRVFKKPVVGTFHGYFMEPEYLKIIGIKREVKSLTRFLWRFAAVFYNQCDLVTTPSKISIDELKSSGVKKPIVQIPNTIFEKKIRKANKDDILKKKYKLKKNILLYVGRFSHEKCLENLIRSFAKVYKKNVETSLLLIGDGPIKNDLKTLSRELNLEDSIVFTDEVAQQDLLTKGYYEIADIFVTMSTSELQPISIIEAMYFGTPLAGVNRRGVGEMIKGVGLLSEPGDIDKFADNINKVLEDADFKEKLGKNSRNEFKTKYSSKKVVQLYEKMYKSIISK